MRTIHLFIGSLFILQTTGCATVEPVTAAEPSPRTPVVIEQRPAADTTKTPIAVTEPPKSTTKPETVVARPRPEITASPRTESPAPEPAQKAPTVATTPTPPARVAAPIVSAPPKEAKETKVADAKIESPAAKAPPKPAPLPARVEPSPPPAAAPAPSEPPSLPPLALTALEQRLKDTGAIGLFTKIALKNQVDDLLSQLKTYYGGNRKTSLNQLRQTYDQLLLKVHDLLKGGDPALAGAIMNSRESIWTVLADPVKFAKL